MLVDMLGGIFSDLSLAFKEDFDIIAGVTYSIVVVRPLVSFLVWLLLTPTMWQVMDAAIIICALVLNPVAKRHRKMSAVAENAPVDDVRVGDVERQGTTPPQVLEKPVEMEDRTLV